jgi:hypothetical protein
VIEAALAFLIFAGGVFVLAAAYRLLSGYEYH